MKILTTAQVQTLANVRGAIKAMGGQLSLTLSAFSIIEGDSGQVYVGNGKGASESYISFDAMRYEYALTSRITNKAEAEIFIRELDAANKLFHFDDSPETIYEGISDVRTFNDEECMLVRRRVAEMRAIDGFDPFELAVELSQ